MSWWNFKRKKTRAKEFVRDFLEENQDEIPPIRKIEQLEFVVLDTETSGLDVAKDHVLSFGAVKIRNLKILVAESLELFPTSSSNLQKSAPIHGMIGAEDRIDLEDFAGRLLPYLGKGILVGHHIGFDLDMLLRILGHFGLEKFPNPVIDTFNLAIRLDHGPLVDRNSINFEAYTLDQLCPRFGIALDDRHTASGDAFLTAHLLLQLLKIASNKGICTLKDLNRSV
jgi:DNA polymerase III subunit epsilon